MSAISNTLPNKRNIYQMLINMLIQLCSIIISEPKISKLHSKVNWKFEVRVQRSEVICMHVHVFSIYQECIMTRVRIFKND